VPLVVASSAAQSSPAPPSFISSTYAGTPFGDSRHPKAPQKIPGRLECELSDAGGEGVAYHDSNGKNSGSGGLNPLDGTYLNGFRADEAVDISYTKDRGTPTQDFSEFNLVTPERDSLYVGWTEAGEWLHYTVLVEKAGRYFVDVMYTSNGEGRFELSVDGALGPPADRARRAHRRGRLPRPRLRARGAPGAEQRVLRLGRGFPVGDDRVRLQPGGLELHPGRQRLGHGSHPPGLSRAPRVAVPLATDGVRARRRHDGLLSLVLAADRLLNGS
jgi:hypothetical protein